MRALTRIAPVAILATTLLSSAFAAPTSRIKQNSASVVTKTEKHVHQNLGSKLHASEGYVPPSIKYGDTTTVSETHRTISVAPHPTPAPTEEEMGFWIDIPRVSLGYSFLTKNTAKAEGEATIGGLNAVLSDPARNQIFNGMNANDAAQFGKNFINDFVPSAYASKFLNDIKNGIRGPLIGVINFDNEDAYKALREFKLDPKATGSAEAERLLATVLATVPDNIKDAVVVDADTPNFTRDILPSIQAAIDAYKQTPKAVYTYQVVTSSVGLSAGYKFWTSECKKFSASAVVGTGLRTDLIYLKPTLESLAGLSGSAREAASALIGATKEYSRYGLFGELGIKLDYSINPSIRLITGLSAEVSRLSYSDANILSAMASWFTPDTSKAMSTERKFGDPEILFGGKFTLGLELKRNQFDYVRHTFRLDIQYTQGTTIKPVGEQAIKLDSGVFTTNIGYGAIFEF